MTGQTFSQKVLKTKQSSLNSFLLGFQSLSMLQICLLLNNIVFVYLHLSGNIVVIVMIFSNDFFNSPMYFFLCNLSLSQMLSTTIITPKCSKFCLVGTLLMTESFLLTVMSYDRFLAICRPLRYSSIMHFWFCCYLALTCWPYLYKICLCA
ncbi:hypothetical protein GDO86_017721 [Hymenochirus boettgeri]|uniref:G-protein coupled receptors family 1 profile domain-containing protein n=1 Tax=Hymenochirus boettgeri TaxID=247094 RepID=A0A8T2INI0_9PIPI|nr:hypothetical protein GDO86_017721 [Hymenochirus boettgeri]